jgi:peptidoglycan-N-acetylmuramic acid deacetylase
MNNTPSAAFFQPRKYRNRLLFAIACLDVVLAMLIGPLGASVSAFSGERVAHTETTEYSWYTMPRTDGTPPAPQPEFSFIGQFGGYWIGSPDSKVIYITFDAGYENGNTPQILDALKKHNATAAFFLVDHYIKTNPDLVKRMADEGHLVCSHSTNHKNMAAMTDLTTFKSEMSGVAERYKSVTGQDIAPYFRPPEGRFSELCLKYVQQMGYKTIFWSFAYKDWYVDAQPSASDAMNTIVKRTHPGMVALLHATSSTNAAILDDLLTEWEEMGYTFGSLDDLTAQPPAG